MLSKFHEPEDIAYSCLTWYIMEELLIFRVVYLAYCCIVSQMNHRISPNRPFEWTGRQHLSATPPQAHCLPLKGSVGRANDIIA